MGLEFTWGTSKVETVFVIVCFRVFSLFGTIRSVIEAAFMQQLRVFGCWLEETLYLEASEQDYWFLRLSSPFTRNIPTHAHTTTQTRTRTHSHPPTTHRGTHASTFTHTQTHPVYAFHLMCRAYDLGFRTSKLWTIGALGLNPELLSPGVESIRKQHWGLVRIEFCKN